MPPARARLANDDPRLDANHPKERGAGNATSSAKPRKNGAAALNALAHNNKDAASIASNSTTAGGSAVQSGAPGIVWTTEDVNLLNNYRSQNRLDAPPAFRSPLSTAVLTAPGIGRSSPTMARRREKRKVSKEQLALIVRKHFNSSAVVESDAIVEFLYQVKAQDSGFKLRFTPSRAR